MISRRDFLSHAALGSGVLAAGQGWAARPAARVTLLHTNDTHSRIDPFPAGKFQGMGGIAQRAAMIRAFRQQQPATLVVDA
ncbi:MAG: twin-arginine translocation signal domain-containing protein [Myxococcota bacterium]